MRVRASSRCISILILSRICFLCDIDGLCVLPSCYGRANVVAVIVAAVVGLLCFVIKLIKYVVAFQSYPPGQQPEHRISLLASCRNVPFLCVNVFHIFSESIFMFPFRLVVCASLSSHFFSAFLARSPILC